MQRQKPKHNWATVAVAVLLAAALVLLRVALRPDEQRENYRNSDASWHTLLTVEALRETPASTHEFLPLISLGEPEDKYIPWAYNLMDSEGNYYYSSFMPAAFITAYLFFEVTGLPLGETGIYVLSSVLSALCFALLALLLWRLFKDKLHPALILVFSFALYFLLPEMLHSNAMVYWAQSLWQLVFLAQLNAYYSLRQKGGAPNWVLFSVLCVLSPLVEWSGYFANAGIALLALMGLFAGWRRREPGAGKKNTWLLLSSAGGCVLATGIFFLRFGLKFDFAEFFWLIYNRYFARGFSESKLGDLLAGYWNSFGWFLVLLLAMLIIALAPPKARRRFGALLKTAGPLLFVSAFALLENLAMIKHATEYTYDRMKAAIPLILLFVVLLAALLPETKREKTAVLALVFALVAGISTLGAVRYASSGYVGAERYRWRVFGYDQNDALAQYVGENYTRENSVVGLEGAVRGYANLLFSRGVYEYCTDDEMVALAAQKGKRYAVVITVVDDASQWNKDIFPKAKVYDTETGEWDIILAEALI